MLENSFITKALKVNQDKQAILMKYRRHLVKHYFKGKTFSEKEKNYYYEKINLYLRRNLLKARRFKPILVTKY